ncbi:MAG: DUF1036 domain-containing protein [Rhizomicrobium sp.]|jgi:uncharacterized membrane protein
MRFVPALLLFLGLTGPALADLSVCNRTAHSARIALGRFNGTDWMSEGWWRVDADKCRTLISGALKARYYYLYAADGGAGSWPGSHGFCVGAAQSFQIYGREDCAKRGFDRRSFYEIDTEQKSDYTTYIAD